MKNKVMVIKWLLISFTFSLPSFSQDEPGEITRTYALTNVHITTAPGSMIKNGTIVIKDGLIHSVGKTVSIPADAQIIPADTMFVYAGFIDGLSHTGVPKPKEDEDRPRDKDPGNPTNERAGITPEKSVSSLLSASDKSVSEFRAAGYTAAHAVPHGRMMPGMGSIVLLDGNNATEMLLKTDMSNFATLKGGQGVFPNTVIAVMTKWRELYKQSLQASSHLAKYKSSSNGMMRPKYDAATMALIPVTKKQRTLYVSAPAHLDIYRVMQLQKDLGFKLTLSNVKNGARLADKIKMSNIPVLLSLDLFKEDKEEEEEKKKEGDAWTKEVEEFNKKKKKEQEMILGQAALFAKKGIKYGFCSDGVTGKKAIENIKRMIKAGLSEKEALTALTTGPAQILGIQQAMGTVQSGKLANIIVSNGPIFDEKSKIRYVFVDGNLHEYEEKKKAKKKSSGEVTDENKVFVGTWEFGLNIQGQEMKGEINISQNDDQELEGTLSVTGLDDTLELANIETDGNKISYTAETDGVEISWSGMVEGETMTGNLNAGPFGSYDVEASRTSGPDHY